MRPPQKVAEAVGKAGCYFLCLLHLVESAGGVRIDALRAYEAAVDSGLMAEDCYVKDPAGILATYLGRGWTVTHEAATYKSEPGELEILRFERPGYSHFVVGDGRGGVAFDPYGASRTVRDGILASKRIARRA